MGEAEALTMDRTHAAVVGSLARPLNCHENVNEPSVVVSVMPGTGASKAT